MITWTFYCYPQAREARAATRLFSSSFPNGSQTSAPDASCVLPVVDSSIHTCEDEPILYETVIVVPSHRDDSDSDLVPRSIRDGLRRGIPMLLGHAKKRRLAKMIDQYVDRIPLMLRIATQCELCDDFSIDLVTTSALDADGKVPAGSIESLSIQVETNDSALQSVLRAKVESEILPHVLQLDNKAVLRPVGS